MQRTPSWSPSIPLGARRREIRARPFPTGAPCAVHVQQSAFAQADDGHSRLQAQELRKPLGAGLALMPGRMDIGVMRVDLELNEPQGAQRRRLNDGHVIRRRDGRASHYAAGAPPDVRGSGTHTRADDLQKIRRVQPRKQMKGVAAADDDGCSRARTACTGSAVSCSDIRLYPISAKGGRTRCA
jgi:hypothetical protein